LILCKPNKEMSDSKSRTTNSRDHDTAISRNSLKKIANILYDDLADELGSLFETVV